MTISICASFRPHLDAAGRVDSSDHGPAARWHDRGERTLTLGHFVALGELRATFGLQLSALAAEFEIDVEEDLASIFPVGGDRHG